MANDDTVGADAPKILNRAQRRAAFFSDKNTKVAPLEMSWNGIDFEWRVPKISEIQKAREGGEDRNFMVTLIMDHSFVDGEKLFDEGDYEDLVNMPFTSDFQKIVTQINGAINLKSEEKAKN